MTKQFEALCRSESLGDHAGWQQALVERYGPEQAQEKVGAFVQRWTEDNPPQSEPQPAATRIRGQPSAPVNYYRQRPPRNRPPRF